jgi:hypothetical protein
VRQALPVHEHGVGDAPGVPDRPVPRGHQFELHTPGVPEPALPTPPDGADGAA